MSLSRTHTLICGRLLVGILSCLLPVLVMGCAATQPFTMPQRTPTDFVLAMTVFVPTTDEHASPARVPARYIVEPDATLRASIGPGSMPTTYPSPTRMLSRDELNSLWSSVRALDPNNPESGFRVINSPEIFNAPGGESVYLLEIRSDKSQRAFAIDADHPGASRLASQLADLAWVRTD